MAGKKKDYEISLKARNELMKKYPGNPLFYDLTDDEVLAIVRAYARVEKALKEEEAAKKEREEKIRQAERESEKDASGFPGDCCD